MAILSDFGLFLYGLLKSAINTGFGLFMFYLILHCILRFLACGNNKSTYKQFRKHFNEGIMNYIIAFAEMSKAHLDSAKLWAENKIRSNNERRRSR